MPNEVREPDLTSAPYKGLESYSEADAGLLFGRTEERDRLVYGLQSSRLTILYGARQVGKTSLLRAAVVNQLRQEAKRRQSGSNPPESAVVLFENWSGHDTIAALTDAINCEFKRLGIPADKLPKPSDGTFVKCCRAWTDCLGGADGGELFLILDDFDHHLMRYPRCDPEPGSFDFELSKVLSTRGLGVNVLIAIRDELLAYLDKYRLTIPGLYGNLFRLEALTAKEAKEAIRNPVYLVYNETHEEQKIGIEAELVEAVLNAVALNRSGGGSAGADSGTATDQRYDAGGLQLAMKAVWDEESRRGSWTLRHVTFEKMLRGIQGIAATYIDKRFEAFDPRERYLSARIFDHLLTPGGVGVAYQLSDLASRVGVSCADLQAVIEKLKQEKMIMASVSGETLGSLYYEMANRVLTPAMLERVQRYHAEKNNKEKELAASVETSLRLFSESSQVDGLNTIIQTCDEWSNGVKNLLVDDQLQAGLRNALGKMLDNLTQKGQLGGYKGAVSSVRYSRDGNFIVTGTETGSVKTWDVRTPGQIRLSREQKHKTWIWGLSASPDGKWFATGSDDGTVALWTVTDSGLQYCRPVCFSADSAAAPLVRSISFSPDGTLLGIATCDGIVRIWHLYEDRIQCEFQASHWAVRAVEFAPDGRSIATGADDGMVGLWDLSGKSVMSDDERSRFKHESPVWGVRFHPNGARLASCSEDHRIKVWNLTTKHEEQTLIGHTCWVLDIDYNFDGTFLASASEDGTARIWDEAGNEVAVLVHGAPVNGVAFSPDGITIATAAADCKLRLWNIGESRDRRSRRQFRHPKKAILLDVSFSCDEKWLAAGGTDNQVQIWDINAGQIKRTLTGHGAWIMSVVFHPSIGSCLATGSIDGTARVRNILNDDIRQFAPKDGPVWSVTFSPDGQLLATGSAGGKVCAWNLLEHNDTPVFCLPGDQGSVWSVRFSPDGRWIAAGCQDGSIRIRDLAGNDVMLLSGVHVGQVLSISFSPDGKYLVSASSEGRICVWDLSTRAKLRVRDLEAPIWAVIFNRTGEMVASGSVDRSVCLWNLGLERLGGHSAEGPIRGLAFNRSGDWLAGSCSDGTVRLWPIGRDDFAMLLARAKSDHQKILPFLWPSGKSSQAARV
jgi:WD40 repeat protein